jgi:hypothetical protein
VATLDGSSSIGYRVTRLRAWTGDVVTAKRRSILGATVLGLLWAAAVVLVAATGLEFLLRVRAYWLDTRAPAVSQPMLEAREEAYDHFNVEDLHPLYFFFFPLDARARAAISNETCRVDADGFRGAGPARAGGRKLAFLLGGSAAFGFLSSSDDATITAYLNRLQDEYFFVNAGVPGWNSTQEMFRLAFQILDYKPALVVTYDGANDARMLEEYLDAPASYPIGTPSNFDVLDGIVRDSQRPAATSVLRRLFPALTVRIDRWRARRDRPGTKGTSDGGLVPESTVREGAARYLKNEARMRDMVAARGARFAAVFQPVSQLHQHVPPGSLRDNFQVIAPFHRAVWAQYAGEFELYDESDAFDREFTSVPVITKDLTASTIFMDEVHLNDPGNEIMARHLVQLLRLRCRGSACS